MDPIAYLFSLELAGIHFGLERIRALTSALGHPQRAYRRVIIAGTNGKGSVTIMVDTALRAAGHRTGCYTSPHLTRVEERFLIDGQPVSTEVLREVATLVRTTVQSLLASGGLATPPTFFEATTAVAFELFRRARVEVVVLEVGLGGRLDATNVEPSMAAALTNIDLDHQQFLGSTIPEIAREKAGVIHPGVITVLGDANPEVVQVVSEVCRAQGARLARTSDLARPVSELRPDGHAILELRTARRAYAPVALGLRGRHQVDNAVTAAILLEELDAAGVRAPREAVELGLAQARWPGRLETMVLGDRQVLLDAAHNPAGARSLAAYLREMHPGGLPIVITTMKDKDAAGMLRTLAPCATLFVLTEAPNPRSNTAAALADVARTVAPGVRIQAEPDSLRALDLAWAAAPSVCVAGSIFLVGHLRAALEGRGAIGLP